jgi:hypothetical protein
MLMASNAIGTTGERGRLCGTGYSAEIVVVSVAMQKAVPGVVPFDPLELLVPLVEVQVPIPKLVVPLVKVTFPVGPFPALGVVTRAESVTLAPEVIVPRLLATAVFVVACVNVNARTGVLVLPEKFLSPEYTAVMLCVPTFRLIG